jgi:hypothetical protein
MGMVVHDDTPPPWGWLYINVLVSYWGRLMALALPHYIHTVLRHITSSYHHGKPNS